MPAVYEVWIKKAFKEAWSAMLYASIFAMLALVLGHLGPKSPLKIHVIGPNKVLVGICWR